MCAFSPGLLLFIYLLHSQQKGKPGPDTTDLKAYLIIYDMNKSSFNAKYAEWIYYAIREFAALKKIFVTANRLSQWKNKLPATVDFINLIN